MSGWIVKEGYDTNIVATAEDLNLPATEVQLFRFRKGKFEHYHKLKTEFFYFTSGVGKVIIDGIEQELKPGSTLLVQPGQRHMFINESSEASLEGIMFKTNNDPSDTYQD
jgi:quercetin dioxygenase-like cupin family protein